MDTNNLWGDLPELNTTKTPVQIVKEQASILTQMTKGVLVGEVKPANWTREFNYILSIRAPALNNYSASILIFGHPIAMYPLAIHDLVSTKSQSICSDEVAFVAALQKTLSSPEARKIISALIVQSNATKATE